jgi:hypothetical protein
MPGHALICRQIGTNNVPTPTFFGAGDLSPFLRDAAIADAVNSLLRAREPSGDSGGPYQPSNEVLSAWAATDASTNWIMVRSTNAQSNISNAGAQVLVLLNNTLITGGGELTLTGNVITGLVMGAQYWWFASTTQVDPGAANIWAGVRIAAVTGAISANDSPFSPSGYSSADAAEVI